MCSYRPVSGLMSGFPAKSPSHTLVQWLFDLALGLLVKSKPSHLPLRGQYQNRQLPSIAEFQLTDFPFHPIYRLINWTPTNKQCSPSYRDEL